MAAPASRYTGTPLVPPPGIELDDKLQNLLACFAIWEPERLRGPGGRSWETDTYQSKATSIITVTAKGAGGTGKTTVAATVATALVLRNQNVVVANIDSQPSLEERMMDKVVQKVYAGDWDLFYRLNGMGGQTILSALRTCMSGPHFRLVPPKVVAVDVVRLASKGNTDTSSEWAR